MSDSKLKVKLENNFIVVCDTNVILRIYDYSPEFTDFALKCLSAIKEHIYMGHTTHIEYRRNYMGKYAGSKKKIENMNSRLIELIKSFEEDISKEFQRIQSYHFPDISELKNSAKSEIAQLYSLFDDYYNDHELLSEINKAYLQNDPIYDFMNTILPQTFAPLTIEEVYKICEEGKKRYKDKIPPGFMDKDKDGIRKYSDLILWKEIIQYAHQNKRDIIFITDDVKADWWEEDRQDDGTIDKKFHKKLVSEFEKNTGQKLIAFTSNDFYKIIADEYGIVTSDVIDMALQQSNQTFIDRVQYKVFEDIQDKLVYSQEEFVEETNQIGSEGLSEFEIENYELVSAEQVDRSEDAIYYTFTYSVCLSATSCEYWGRDDDTKEIITSPDNQHEFEGTLTVQITRYVDQFLDFSFDDKFDDAEIIECSLAETKFVSCYDYDEEPADNYCPQCGKPLTIENDALNGFCNDCTLKYDK